MDIAFIPRVFPKTVAICFRISVVVLFAMLVARCVLLISRILRARSYDVHFCFSTLAHRMKWRKHMFHNWFITCVGLESGTCTLLVHSICFVSKTKITVFPLSIFKTNRGNTENAACGLLADTKKRALFRCNHANRHLFLSETKSHNVSIVFYPSQAWEHRGTNPVFNKHEAQQFLCLASAGNNMFSWSDTKHNTASSALCLKSTRATATNKCQTTSVLG